MQMHLIKLTPGFWTDVMDIGAMHQVNSWDEWNRQVACFDQANLFPMLGDRFPATALIMKSGKVYLVHEDMDTLLDRIWDAQK